VTSGERKQQQIPHTAQMRPVRNDSRNANARRGGQGAEPQVSPAEKAGRDLSYKGGDERRAGKDRFREAEQSEKLGPLVA